MTKLLLIPLAFVLTAAQPATQPRQEHSVLLARVREMGNRIEQLESENRDLHRKIAHMTSTLQEQQSEIEKLEAKVASMENRAGADIPAIRRHVQTIKTGDKYSVAAVGPLGQPQRSERSDDDNIYHFVFYALGDDGRGGKRLVQFRVILEERAGRITGVRTFDN